MIFQRRYYGVKGSINFQEPKLPTLKIPFEIDENNEWTISLEEFYEFINSHSSKEDKRKTIRKFNIASEIQKYTDQAEISDKDMKISATSAYRYIFHHYDDYLVCKSLCDELIQSHMPMPKQPSQTSSESRRSIYELYKEVSKSIPKWLNTYTSIPDEEYDADTSLHETYREEFSESEWKAIKLFEYHFKKFDNVPVDASHETILDRKYSFFKLCKVMNEYRKETSKTGTMTCKSNILPKATSWADPKGETGGPDPPEKSQ